MWKKEAKGKHSSAFFFWCQCALLLPFPRQLPRPHCKRRGVTERWAVHKAAGEGHGEGGSPVRLTASYGCEPQQLPASSSCPLHIYVSTPRWSLTLVLQPLPPGNILSNRMCCLEEENGLWYVSRKEAIKEKQPTSLLSWLASWKAATSWSCAERWPTAGNEWNHLVPLPSVPIALGAGV